MLGLVFVFILMFVLIGPNGTKNNSRYQTIGKGANKKIKDKKTGMYLIT